MPCQMLISDAFNTEDSTKRFHNSLYPIQSGFQINLLQDIAQRDFTILCILFKEVLRCFSYKRLHNSLHPIQRGF